MRISDPHDYPAIFGTNFAKRNGVPIIVIGQRSYNRYELGMMGCPHTQAAREVNRVLHQLNAKSLEDVARRFSPSDFAVKGFGVTAFYVLTCLLQDAGLSLKQFYQEKVTWDTLKSHSARKSKKRRAA